MPEYITPIKPLSIPKHFFLLDILRGFAALTVVLWHWQHFYTLKNGAVQNFQITQQPFYNVLYVFYNYGFVAVDLFFLISGFVFFYLYSDKIANRGVSPKSFFIFRFSRLYPLHLITLIVVCLLQYHLYSTAGGYFVYTSNDLYHFLLNIFFATSWGLEKGESFNGPNWSVSVEVLLYLLFFAICWFRLNKNYFLVSMMILGLVVHSFYQPMGRGLYSFFFGGLLYQLYLFIIKSDKTEMIVKVLGIINLLFVLLIAVEAKYTYLQYYSMKFLHGNFHYNIIVYTVVFPSFVLYLILLETLRGPKGKRFSFIGNISYSSYLLHFPLQLLIICIFGGWEVKKTAFFNSGYTLLGFFSLLIVLSLASFYFFELPVQNFLRGNTKKKKVGTNQIAPSNDVLQA